MERQVKEFNTEFNNVVTKSGIQKLIQLKWKIDRFNINEICQITTESDIYTKPEINPNSRRNLCYPYVISSYKVDKSGPYL